MLSTKLFSKKKKKLLENSQIFGSNVININTFLKKNPFTATVKILKQANFERFAICIALWLLKAITSDKVGWLQSVLKWV